MIHYYFSETWARSKAVVNIISSTKLQSKYQHTYHLHGSIIDENNGEHSFLE